MPSISFESWKALMVESGASRQTIRPERKRPIKAGDRLIFFTGQRTKACRRLGEATCEGVQAIKIEEAARILLDRKNSFTR